MIILTKYWHVSNNCHQLWISITYWLCIYLINEWTDETVLFINSRQFITVLFPRKDVLYYPVTWRVEDETFLRNNWNGKPCSVFKGICLLNLTNFIRLHFFYIKYDYRQYGSALTRKTSICLYLSESWKEVFFNNAFESDIFTSSDEYWWKFCMFIQLCCPS